MGAATRGGGAVESGPKNKMMSEPSKSTGIPMMAKGGMANKGNVNEHKRMAMGKPIGKMGGGMMTKGYASGGMAKGMMSGGMMSKGYAAGGAAKKMAKKAK
jgi:hypothetical protein